MNKFKQAFTLFIAEVQAPSTQAGKSARDGIFTGFAWLAVTALEQLNQIDFGGANFLIAAVIGAIIAKINRQTRTIKREQ